jgi:aryl carrier-like protein
VNHIKDVLHEMYDDDDVEKQADWLVTYKIDSIRLGRMCEKFPALQKSWSDFKMVYELCRSQDDIDRQDP